MVICRLLRMLSFCGRRGQCGSKRFLFWGVLCNHTVLYCTCRVFPLLSIRILPKHCLSRCSISHSVATVLQLLFRPQGVIVNTETN